MAIQTKLSMGWLAVVVIVLGSILRASDGSSIQVPGPTGPYAVGTFWVMLSDPGRSNPFLDDGSRREVLVRFWYPAPRLGSCTPAPYMLPKVSRYFSEKLGISAPELRTNSCYQAPVLTGRHPVVLASHGYTGMLTDYTFLFEDLASHGYVVASIAHTYESTAVEFPDGKLITSAFGTHLLEGSLRMDEKRLKLARSLREGDINLVSAQLRRWSESGGALSGRLDLEKIGALGHSLGADTVMVGLKDPEVKAAVLLDPVALSAASTASSSKPVLLVSDGRPEWSVPECVLWNNLHGEKRAILFPGADHFASSDAVWLATSIAGIHSETGVVGPERMIAATRTAVAAFFDWQLSESPPGRLLNGLSTEYSDVVVTTKEQALCRLTPVHRAAQ